jgi:sugar lactone lactonase YvrE
MFTPSISARLAATAAASAFAMLLATSPYAQQAAPQGNLQQVATFPHQVTGVTVSKDGRIFVNFPRWTEDSPISVAEVQQDGSLKPYPDEEWNSWRNAKKNQMSAQDHFICVQSVVADGQGNLWVIDPAAPAMDKVVPGGPKLVKIDLSSNKVAQTIRFDDKVAPQGSYLNDVRISPDGRHAYITDSGAKGAIVVVDLRSGQARRTLDGHPSTQVEKDVVVKTDGRELRRPDGRAPEFSSDGIAMSPDGSMIYWQALTGKTLYGVPTAALENSRMASRELESRVKKVGENGVADGLLMSRQGRLYVTALEENAVKVRNGDQLAIVVQDDRLRWPDTLSEGPDGAIYVTSSRIQDSAIFKPEAGPQLETQLWRFDAPQEATGSVNQEMPAAPKR